MGPKWDQMAQLRPTFVLVFLSTFERLAQTSLSIVYGEKRLTYQLNGF